jgi:hypothetical protein
MFLTPKLQTQEEFRAFQETDIQINDTGDCQLCALILQHSWDYFPVTLINTQPRLTVGRNLAGLGIRENQRFCGSERISPIISCEDLLMLFPRSNTWMELSNWLHLKREVESFSDNSFEKLSQGWLNILLWIAWLMKVSYTDTDILWCDTLSKPRSKGWNEVGKKTGDMHFIQYCWRLKILSQSAR